MANYSNDPDYERYGDDDRFDAREALTAPPAEADVAMVTVVAYEASDSISQLAMALSKAQGQIEDAEKDSANPHFKMRYASLAAVRRATRDPLSANGLSLLQFPNTVPRNISVTTLLLHDSGEFIRSTISMPVQKWTPQGIGSTISYARRYAKMAILDLAAEDDDAELVEQRNRGRFEGAPGKGKGKAPPVGPAADSIAMLAKMVLNAKTLEDVEALTRNPSNQQLVDAAEKNDRVGYDAFWDVLDARRDPANRVDDEKHEQDQSEQTEQTTATGYDEEASLEAYKAMVADLKPIAAGLQNPKMTLADADQLKLDLEAWSKKHERERNMLQPAGREEITKKFRNMQVELKKRSDKLNPAE